MIRAATPNDAEAIAAIYAPYVEQTCVSFEEVPPTVDVMRERMAALLPTHPWLVVEEGGDVMGYAYAGPHRARRAYRWSVDSSICLAQGHHRKGVGKALYGHLIEILRRQGFRSCFAGIALPNAASVALHERFGFEPVGVYREAGFKFGAWRDVGWWRLALAEGDGPMPESIPFSQLGAP